MILSGEPVDADRRSASVSSRACGLTRSSPGAWRAYARALAEGATEAYALSKEGLNAAWERDFASFLELESSLQDRAGRSDDYAEGVRAFTSRTAAKFQGR
jgi:enoyl-CoA hydratase/carnithine racemase